MSPKLEIGPNCQHVNARGHRCRLPRAADHESLCAFHLRQSSSAAQRDDEALAAQLLASTGRLSSAREVNALLGNLVQMLAHKRIDRKDAIAIAYMSQLLLTTLTPIEKELQAEQRAASERAYAQRMAEMNAARAKEAAAAPPTPPTAPLRAAFPASPAASVAPPDSPPSQPPKTYADVRT